MTSLHRLLSLLFLVIITSVTGTANAQIKDGEATVVQGSTVTVSIGTPYQTTLNRATGINYTWTAGSSAISIQSKTNKTCTIKGNSLSAHPLTEAMYQLCVMSLSTNPNNAGYQ